MAAENLGGYDMWGGGKVAAPLGPAFNLVGGGLCLVGLLIRLGLLLHWGASDLLAVKLLLLHFHKDTMGYTMTWTQFYEEI